MVRGLELRAGDTGIIPFISESATAKAVAMAPIGAIATSSYNHNLAKADTSAGAVYGCPIVYSWALAGPPILEIAMN